MLQRGATVFIDTTAIAAAHAIKGWAALRRGFKLVTVPVCLDEATRPNRDGLVLVNTPRDVLAAELSIAEVTDVMRYELIERLEGVVSLDPGERDLVALAYARRQEIWWLCGPDKATLRALNHLNWVDRMVSLEEGLRAVGCACDALEKVQTKRWLEDKRTKLKLGDTFI